MLRTTYLNLKKPEGSDPVNVQDFNDNADTIDTEVNARVKSSGGDIANTMVSAFTASTASYPVPAAGETPKVFMGKIKKFFEDFKSFKDSIVTKTMIINQILNDSTKAASAATVYSVNEKVDSAISDLALEDVGNAVAATNWTVVASNRVMNNDLGMVYGKIIHNASVAPVWGELVATFPGFKSYYDMPLPLYCTDGNLYITANLNAAGQIKLYNPDLAKLNTKDKVYSFTAVYLRKK